MKETQNEIIKTAHEKLRIQKQSIWDPSALELLHRVRKTRVVENKVNGVSSFN